jgi:hypothetical protein
MSDIYYEDDPVYDSWILGLQISGIIIAIWVLYAMFVYRYSADRVGGLILQKYEAVNASKLPKNSFFDFSNVVVYTDSASCNVDVKDNDSQQIVSTDSVTYSIKDDCSTDFKCINV